MISVRPLPDTEDVRNTRTRSRLARAVGLVALLAALSVAILASLAIGARAIPPLEVIQILIGTDAGQNAMVIHDLRIPRTLIAIVAGAALGVSGALIQAVTRNPLADPGILGVNAGAAFALAVGTGLAGVSGALGTLSLAYLGAFAASLVVYAIGSLGRDGASPVRLILAGVALGAVLAGITQAIVLTDRQRFAVMTSWQSGSLLDRDSSLLTLAAPLVLLGLLIALFIGSSLNAIALGDDLASALGANVLRTRIFAVTAVMLLAGGATAGRAHRVRRTGGAARVRSITGPDNRWVLAYTVLAAPILLVGADIIGRVVVQPAELSVGIVTAIIGAPVFIALVRRRRVAQL